MVKLRPLDITINRLVARARRAYCLQFFARALPFAVLTVWVTMWFSASVGLTLASVSLLLACTYWLLLHRSQLSRITAHNFLLHLNSQFDELEHSAQLLGESTSKTSLLRELQSAKVEQQFKQIIQRNPAKLIPHYPLRASLSGSVMIAAIIISLWWIDPLSHWNGGMEQPPAWSSAQPQGHLISASVTVVAPDYTAMGEHTTEQLDLSLIAGSDVTWKLRLQDPQGTVTLVVAGEPPIPFTRHKDGSYQVQKRIDRSGVYHLSDDNGVLGTLHSIAASFDHAPQIRIVEPASTISEFAKKSAAMPTMTAQISDDFGLSKVDILASVAKGSGEAVKFRDQVFTFDRSSSSASPGVYQKKWDFAALDMEPGDELYFTVRAWDNKTPEAQLSRSITKIYRWLDDDEQVIMSDGILIDFMPEYFKSQRQIIIETQQLIADKGLLPAAQFDQMSRALGHAQADLKHKYGQYLGDEFDDGSGGHTMEEGPAVPQVHIKDGDHNDEQQQDDSAQLAAGESNASSTEHAHSDEDHHQDSAIQDKSGYSQVIEQFGHAHGDADVGLFGTLSPTALMKQAIAYMWDAELQLLMSRPAAALPHEKNALTYLNRAKKAERIYVKRLGFEPPPVTEQRRYQGDLNDILSYRRQTNPEHSEQQSEAIGALLDLMMQTDYQQSPRNNGVKKAAVQKTSSPLSEAQQRVLQQVKQLLLDQSQNRPAMIHHVTTIEKIQLLNQIGVSDCSLCEENLAAELWRQLPQPVALPAIPKDSLRPLNAITTRYAKRVLELDRQGQ